MKKETYTVKEIDDLRSACQTRYLYGSTHHGKEWSRSFKEDEMLRTVEDQVKTYMLAGITAEDIYEADRPKENNPDSGNTSA